MDFSPRLERPTLGAVLDRRLLIVTGKGGVGRSAVAAALALRAAHQGRRVLAVAAAEGLGLHLGRRPLAYEPAEIRPGLWGMVADPTSALDEYLRLQLHLPRLGPAVRPLRMLAEAVPGVRDTVVIGKILAEVRGRSWDLVVVDGPPAGHITSLLRAPTTILGLVGGGRIEEQAGWMRDLLADESATGLVVVALPEELPITETLETLGSMAAEPVASIAAVVLNRVLPDDVPASLLRSLPEGHARDAALLHRGLVATQHAWGSRIAPSHHLPYLFGLQTPTEVAARLAEAWRDP